MLWCVGFLGGRRAARSRGEAIAASLAALSAEAWAPAELTGRADSGEPAMIPSPAVARNVALTVPAVVRARELVCGTLGRLPVRMHGADRRRVESVVLGQPEAGVASSVTWTQTYEDLLLYGVAWWAVMAADRVGRPVQVRRVPPDACTAQQRQVTIRNVDGVVLGHRVEWEDIPGLLRFESPHPPLLTVGARAIRALLRLEAAALVYADSPPMHEFFTPRDGADPASDEEIVGFLNRWKAARKRSSTAYVPYALSHNQAKSMTPEDMQLIDSRRAAVLEIARLTGIDPEYLGISTTSRTYKNNVDAKYDLVDFTLSGWAEAVDGRLSLDDVTPPGSYVNTDFSQFLRANEAQRMSIYERGLRVGAWSPERIAEAENVPAGEVRPVVVAPVSGGQDA